MRIFIIRPFGLKENIDFDRVEGDLIMPALNALRRPDFPVVGSTTGEISSQGNIREDMFRLIAVADLVIVDVSIHNANVFYELGMRHALTRKHTFLIRSETSQPYPFDLQTDRYFLYDAKRPGDAVAKLSQALRSTLASPRADSPMFQLLPALQPHGRGQLVTVPADFKANVSAARATGERGKLRLLADEAQWFEWDQEGLQLVGEAQFKLRDYPGSCHTFGLLQQRNRGHVQARLRLGTIYQRLAQQATGKRQQELFNLSEQAINEVLELKPANADLVEANSLLASNEKARWIDELNNTPATERFETTLRSAHFCSMSKHYLRAVALDLNAYYPAVNAWAALKIQSQLAQAIPAVWSELHDSDAHAQAELDRLTQRIAHLTGALKLSLGLDQIADLPVDTSDVWRLHSRADFQLLATPDRTAQVLQAYKLALKDADYFTLEAARRHLGIYLQLNLFEPALSPVVKLIDDSLAKQGQQLQTCSRVLLFTGHMLDAAGVAPERKRFPRTPEAEALARAMIREAVQNEVGNQAAQVIGIAGGACGADILFHEVCAELGVRTELHLALPEDQYSASSVRQGGPAWVERYRKLTERLPTYVLQQQQQAPDWLAGKSDYSLWERNNHWNLYSSMAIDTRHRTVIALLNREREANGPGGTIHLVEQAEQLGFKTHELDARALLAPL